MQKPDVFLSDYVVKYPNLYRRLILEEDKTKKKIFFFSFFEGGLVGVPP